MNTASLLSLLHHEPEETYHRNRAVHLSSHALADFRANPLLFRRKEQGLVGDGDRPAFAMGRAIHCRVLEGRDVFHRRYAVGGPINPKTGKSFGADTKTFTEWAAQQGRPVVSDDTATLCERLAEAVSGHEGAAALLAEGVPEGVVRASLNGVSCQARLDWTHPERGIIDLKSIDALEWFETESRSYGYVYQMAFYRAVLAAVCGRLVDVHLIGVEKSEPYRVGVWRIAPQALDAAARENAAAIERLKICRAQDRWPTGYESIRTFDYFS